MLKHYNNFNAIRNSTPSESYKEDYNAIVDLTFDNALNVFYGDSEDAIEFEYEYGSNIFEKVPIARVDSVVNFNTGIMVGDDFKIFEFKPDFPQLSYGMKFRWKNSYWLVINTNNYESVSVTAEVRRCNNVLRFFNKDGNKVYEPCIIDNILRFTNNVDNPPITTGNNEIKIWCQRNSRTTELRPNDRFLFGTPNQRLSMRIVGGGIKNFLNTISEDENSPTIIEFYMEHYQIGVNDDLVNGFANNITTQNNSLHDIIISPNQDYILQDSTLNIECFLYDNNIKQDNAITIRDISTEVPNDKYVFNIIDGNHFSIVNKGMFIDSPILIECSVDGYSKIFSFILRGLY